MRVYSPTLTRWITRDPSGESSDANLYRFDGNDPINHSDPSGLDDSSAATRTAIPNPTPAMEALNAPDWEGVDYAAEKNDLQSLFRELQRDAAGAHVMRSYGFTKSDDYMKLVAEAPKVIDLLVKLHAEAQRRAVYEIAHLRLDKGDPSAIAADSAAFDYWNAESVYLVALWTEIQAELADAALKITFTPVLGTVLRGKAAADAAAKLGYGRRVAPQKLPFDSHGQPGFTDGKDFITPDADSHIGGVWKIFSKGGERIGTLDADGNIIGD